VTGVGQTALTVNGDARITGVLTVGQGSVTIGSTNITTQYINDIQYPTAGPLSNRNLIINGAMTVHQRSDDLTASGFIADRWRFNAINLDQWAGDATWETDAPAGFSRSIKMNTTTAETTFDSDDELSFETRIEAQDLQHLDWGTANAKSITLSFWVKCNKIGTQSIHVRAHDADDGYTTSYSINAADTWEPKTIVIAGNTAGSITNDNGIGIWIRWIAADGSTANTEDAWDTSNRGPFSVSSAMTFGTTINDYLQITGVQLEVGSKATPFEHELYSQTLLKCMRYYQEYTSSTNGLGIAGAGFVETTTQTEFAFFLTVPMRTLASASITEIGTLQVKVGSSSFAITGLTSVAFNDNFSLATVRTTNSNSGASTGTVARLRSDGVGAGFQFNAEL